MKVYMLSKIDELDNSVKLIGYYSSNENAEKVRNILLTIDYLKGKAITGSHYRSYVISNYELDVFPKSHL